MHGEREPRVARGAPETRQHGTLRNPPRQGVLPPTAVTVPVLRNMVPSQVLLGNSSFNTGESISAGLPGYARNRAKAIAEIMERG